MIGGIIIKFFWKMKIYIRYFRQFVFGNYSTLAFDVDPECLVIELKKMIFARIRVEV